MATIIPRNNSPLSRQAAVQAAIIGQIRQRGHTITDDGATLDGILIRLAVAPHRKGWRWDQIGMTGTTTGGMTCNWVMTTSLTPGWTGSPTTYARTIHTNASLVVSWGTTDIGLRINGKYRHSKREPKRGFNIDLIVDHILKWLGQVQETNNRVTRYHLLGVCEQLRQSVLERPIYPTVVWPRKDEQPTITVKIEGLTEEKARLMVKRVMSIIDTDEVDYT